MSYTSLFPFYSPPSVAVSSWGVGLEKHRTETVKWKMPYAEGVKLGDS